MDVEGWKNLGFTKRQAASILNYKKSLGGFSNLSQLEKSFVITKEKFESLKNYIKFDPNKFKEIKKKQISEIQKYELNSIKIGDLIHLVKDKKMAFRILNYRNALGGFFDVSQLSEVYEITNELIKELEKISLNPSQIKKISLNEASYEEFRKHPYLREFAKKITTYKQEKGLFQTFDPLKEIIKEEKKISKILLYLSL